LPGAPPVTNPTDAASPVENPEEEPPLLGHPVALYVLFMTELWERFSYYGMRALLVLYMTKGFLSYEDGEAYKVYGAYTALVYMTPFFGGMIADRLLGARRAVILGGLLMAGGPLLMTVESEIPFLTALALLIVGNGFFKPNISTMVGGMYGDNDPRRDGGFTIFYMGINMGAAAAPLLCGALGELYGWHYGFGLATLGMLVGLAVFVVPAGMSRWITLGGAVATAAGMVLQSWGVPYVGWVNAFVALALAAAGVIAFRALSLQGLPPEMGGPPSEEALNQEYMGLTAEWAVYGASVIVVPAFAVLVWSNRHVRLIPEAMIEPMIDAGGASMILGTFMSNLSTLPGMLLMLTAAGGFVYLMQESFREETVEARQRIWVVLALMIPSMMFWAFFEQAGSSMNLFTDRNVDRVFEARSIDADEVGETLTFRVGPPTAETRDLPRVNQEQLGYVLHGEPFTMTRLSELEEAVQPGSGDADRTLSWPVDEAHVGMGVGGDIVPTSAFQSANPIYILLFGIPFSWLWLTLAKRKLDPSAPVKFGLGLLQLGLGFLALWWGAEAATDRGMVHMLWLLMAYLLHTTGELCLSPVGLSMVTKLSPKRLVSTTMGAWFLALALSNLLAAIIAVFTGVGHGGGGEASGIPVPAETLPVYAGVFQTIGFAACLAAFVLFAVSPILTKWMHGVK